MASRSRRAQIGWIVKKGEDFAVKQMGRSDITGAAIDDLVSHFGRSLLRGFSFLFRSLERLFTLGYS